MKRLLALILVATVLLIASFTFLATSRSHRIASEIFTFGPTRVQFVIEKVDGNVYASANELRSWTHGFHATRPLAKSDQQRDEVSSIQRIPGSNRVEMRFGPNAIVYDPASRTFVE